LVDTTGLGTTTTLTTRQSITFLVPLNTSCRLTSAGGGTRTLSSLFELSL
jgi:hypothetical protein